MTGISRSNTAILVDLVRRYSNKSYQGTVLTRVLAKARESARTDDGLPVDHKPLHKLSQRLTPEVITRLVEAYQAGATTGQLRERFGLSHGSVVKLLQDNSVETRSRAIPQAEIQQMIQLYESGLSIAKVSRKLGRAESTVWRTLLRAGTTMRPRGGSYR